MLLGIRRSVHSFMLKSRWRGFCDREGVKCNTIQIKDSRTVSTLFSHNLNTFVVRKNITSYYRHFIFSRYFANMAPVNFDYDLVVIGGGSGGLSASKEAANLGKKVAVCDFVKPTPIGTTWGLGGTCVNVGCIPKKLMHQAALLGTAMDDAKVFGWELPEKRVQHNWQTMVQAVQDNVKSSNWGYRVALREHKVTYLNAYAKFIDQHTLSTVDKKGNEKTITGKQFIISTGLRPRYPDIPGAREYGITSDDLFSLPYNPGKTLLVGASYIALECAGFLSGFGNDTTVMVRSILLRGFDQQMAEMIGSHMETHGVKFIRECVPLKLERVEEGEPGKIKVTAQKSNGEIIEDIFSTVIFAIGREARTNEIGLDRIGVQVTKNGKIPVNEKEETNVAHVYAIGDVLEDKWELTPVAIQAGKLLARRLFANGTELTDYVNVPTTVFTPLEYGCVGLSEDKAVAKYGASDIEVFHSYFNPTEINLPKRDLNTSYAKLICVKSENMRVVGFHIVGANAGEITQGFAIALKFGAKKSDFDSLIAIHPTAAEIFTMLSVTKSSGESPLQKLCCG